MTISLHYRATLLDNISLPTTTGRTDILPGALFLGAVAKRYQEAEERGIAWELFHDGTVSFGDARVLDPHTKSPVIKTPLSLHAPKRAHVNDDPSCSFADFSRRAPHQRLDVWSDAPESERQPELVSDQIGASGWLKTAQKGYALKTSIDFHTQRAKEGALFGHSFLKSGQSFGFTVLIDADHPKAEALKSFVIQGLAHTVHVGKSRSAEFGAVQLELITDPSEHWAESNPLSSEERERFQDALHENHDNTSEQVVSYLLLSETCFFDERSGRPSLKPSAADFGLDERFRLAADYCFTRNVSWVPFNGHRRRPDLQRVALVAGSVVSFVAPKEAWAELDLNAHLKRLEMGVGLYSSEGLGRVRVAHPFLVNAGLINERRAQHPKTTSSQQSRTYPNMPKGSLADWMLRKNQEGAFQEQALSVALDLMLPPAERPQQSRDCDVELSQFTQNKSNQPTRSQWRNLEFETRIFLHKQGGLKYLRERLTEGSNAVLVSGKAKERWRLESSDRRSEFSRDEVKRRAGPAVATMLTDSFYEEHYPATIESLTQLLAQAETKRAGVDLKALVIDRLAPLVMVHAARLIAAKLQDKEG